MDLNFGTVSAAFTAVARRQPAATALVHDERSYSYAQLETYSNAIAQRLSQLNTQHGDSVALCLDRSIHAVAAMLGVLKAGAVFVPLDPSFPNNRLSYIIEDAGVRVVLCTPNYQSKFRCDSLTVMTLSELPKDDKQTACTSTRPVENDRAYIMYTSSSTGAPKGVPISHRALMNYCVADAQIYELQSEDRTLQFSTLSFDIAIEEIFPPLVVGSTVVIRPTMRSNAQIELSDIIERFRISALHIATGYWHEWVDLMKAADARVPDSVRLMVVTGEKVSPEHYQRWITLVDKPVLWANAYGPTETTVSATVFIPPERWRGKALPIGKPIKNYVAYILNSDQTKVGQQETGELYIGGPGLAEGYLNRDDLTEGAFFPDPFSSEPGARMYKTGDLARWMNDGNIDYAGRVDDQIKVGSYRIEPGEIENALAEHSAVKEVMVVADEVDGKKRLLAYVASDNFQDNLPASANDLATHLKVSLPNYMIPARYVFMQHFPKTLNGKIDRSAMPDSSDAVAPKSSHYKPPTGAVEEKLCVIWSDVLGVPEVGANDSFVSLGGDSLQAVRTIARIRKDLDFTISTRDFFYLDTVALVAGYIQGKAVERVVPAPIPEYINTGGRQLYTFLQVAKPEIANGIGVLIVPPVGNEHRRIQRPLRLLMQNLARQGFATLRFDWTGTGNSSGHAEDVDSVEQWCRDIQDAAELLSRTYDIVDVVAIRLGAFIAAQTDLSWLPIRQRCYWDPVSSGQQWLQDMRQLQSALLQDTYAFLKVRKPIPGPTLEVIGLSMNEQLQASLKTHTMSELLADKPWNSHCHLILGNVTPAQPYAHASSQLHVVEENNDWIDERKKTVDVQINKSASKLADLLTDKQLSGSKVAHLEPTYENTKSHSENTRSSRDLDHPVEQVHTFGESSQLVGVFTPPLSQSSCSVCVLYLTAGLLHNIGPTRLHVEVARALSTQSIAGFRFDLSGVGDSETSSLGGYFTGRSVLEVQSAMDFIAAHYHIEQFVLLGLCSGADDALATAQQDERVKGVVLLNGYAYQAGNYKLFKFKELYLPRLLMLDKWKNRFSSLLMKFKGSAGTVDNNTVDTISNADRKAIIALDDDYRYVPPLETTAAIIDTLTGNGVNLYFIYNGSEYEEYSYEGQLFEMFPEQLGNPRLQEAYIKEADHTFSLRRDRDKLTGWLSDWFSKLP